MASTCWKPWLSCKPSDEGHVLNSSWVHVAFIFWTVKLQHILQVVSDYYYANGGYTIVIQNCLAIPLMSEKNKYLHIYFCVALDCVVEIPMFTPMIVRVSFTCSQIYKLSVAILFCSERRLAKPGQTQRKKPKNLPAAPQGPPWGPPKAPRARGVRHPCPEDPPGPPQ